MVRTMAEIHEDPERIRVTVDVELSRRYTDEDVARLQASEAELVAAPLQTRINALENRITNLSEFRRAAEERVAELEAELARSREATALALNARNEFDRDRRTERDRADRMTATANRLETERAELDETHRQSIAARDRLLEQATRRISAARDMLTADAVAQARGMDCSRLGATMADAIGNALRCLDA